MQTKKAMLLTGLLASALSGSTPPTRKQGLLPGPTLKRKSGPSKRRRDKAKRRHSQHTR